MQRQNSSLGIKKHYKKISKQPKKKFSEAPKDRVPIKQLRQTMVRPIETGQVYTHTNNSEVMDLVVRVSAYYVWSRPLRYKHFDPIMEKRDIYEKRINDWIMKFVTKKDMRPWRKRLLGIR